MATSVSRVSGLLTVAAVVVTLGNLTACTPKPNGPEPTAEQFFAALATGDTGDRGGTERPPRRRAPSAQQCVGGTSGDPPRRADPQLEVRRGHRQRHLPLHLASAQGPHLDLRRTAEPGSRRGPLGSALEHHRVASQARRKPDVGVARGPAPARLGERARRQRRVGARLSVQLLAGCSGGRWGADADFACRRRCAAAVRQHAGSATPRRAGQLVEAAVESHHAAPVRP